MAELTTIARPYAEAAFRLARERNNLPGWSQLLEFASAVVTDPRVASALDNPKLSIAEKEALLLSLCDGQADDLGRNFIKVLVDADRVAVLPQIATLFETLKNEADGVDEARIDTAFALSDAQFADLKSGLEKHFGKTIQATVNIVPALIGGARITVGDTVIDGTIEAQLSAMATQLRA